MQKTHTYINSANSEMHNFVKSINAQMYWQFCGYEHMKKKNGSGTLQ